jgi:hypothetical protein
MATVADRHLNSYFIFIIIIVVVVVFESAIRVQGVL